MYVSVCVSIYSLFIYIYIYTYPIQYIVQGGDGFDPLWRWVEVTIPFNIFIYICVCVLCEYIHIIYIYTKGVTDFTPYEAKLKLLSRSIMFNIYCSEGVGGFDPLWRQVVGEGPVFFQRSLPGVWAADATSPSNQAADTQPQLRLGDPIYRWLFNYFWHGNFRVTLIWSVVKLNRQGHSVVSWHSACLQDWVLCRLLFQGGQFLPAAPALRPTGTSLYTRSHGFCRVSLGFI